VALGRPSRLLAREVEVDLLSLAAAARDAARSLCLEIAAVDPSFARHRASRRLFRAVSRLERRVAPAPEPPLPASRARAHRPRRRRGAPSCGFELRDDEGLIPSYLGTGPDLGSLLAPGRVTLRSAAGPEILALEGAPFLLLRDLAAVAGRIASSTWRGEGRVAAALALPGRRETASLVFDLGRGTLSVGRRREVACAPLLAARALLEATVDFCGAVLARNPRQAGNGHLTELHAGASETLALVREMLAGDMTARTPPPAPSRQPLRAPAAPLGPGRMKRIVFQEVLEAEVGAPAGEGLWRSGGRLVACGTDASLGLEATTGEVRWRGPGATWASSWEESLLLAAEDRLTCLDAATGRRRWSRPLAGPLEAAPRALCPLRGGGVALVGASAISALDLSSGRPLWRFEPPVAMGLAASAFGGLVVAGADTGFLYGIDGTGRVAWRQAGPGKLLAPPVPWGEECLALCEGDRGAHLLALEAATGHRRWDALVDLSPAGPPVPFAGLCAVAGTVAGDAVVVAIEPGGLQAWASAPSLGEGPFALAPLRAGLAAKVAAGASAAFDREGRATWTHAREIAHPPPGNLPPVACRGVLVVPCDEILALEATSGARLGVLPGIAPTRLSVGDDLSLAALDPAGVLTAVRLASHLSVV
jgi:outer membrane protein assembly factor BamB